MHLNKAIKCHKNIFSNTTCMKHAKGDLCLKSLHIFVFDILFESLSKYESTFSFS